MIGLIIWIAVIIVIVNYSRNNKKKPGNVPKGVKKPAAQNSMPQRQAMPPAPNPMPQRQAIPDTPAGGSTQRAKQEALKRRLQQQYGKPSVPQNTKKQEAANAQPKGSDILSRATANVDEDFRTDTYSKEVEHARAKPIGMADDCDLMREVQDLIVMGYQGTMQFSRDFIGEAEDMLNSFL